MIRLCGLQSLKYLLLGPLQEKFIDPFSDKVRELTLIEHLSTMLEILNIFSLNLMRSLLNTSCAGLQEKGYSYKKPAQSSSPEFQKSNPDSQTQCLILENVFKNKNCKCFHSNYLENTDSHVSFLSGRVVLPRQRKRIHINAGLLRSC